VRWLGSGTLVSVMAADGLPVPCARVTDVWDLVEFNPPGQYCS
jgi:hypothetical protein